MPVGEKIRSIDERPKSTGIVSEILVGTLVDSKNEFLSHPCDVVLHVMERTTDGDINPYKVSVCTGHGLRSYFRKPDRGHVFEIPGAASRRDAGYVKKIQRLQETFGDRGQNRNLLKKFHYHAVGVLVILVVDGCAVLVEHYFKAVRQRRVDPDSAKIQFERPLLGMEFVKLL